MLIGIFRFKGFRENNDDEYNSTRIIIEGLDYMHKMV